MKIQNEKGPEKFEVQVGTVFKRKDGRGEDVIIELLPDENAFQGHNLTTTDEGILITVSGGTGTARDIGSISGVLKLDEFIEGLKRGKADWGQILSQEDIDIFTVRYSEGRITIAEPED